MANSAPTRDRKTPPPLHPTLKRPPIRSTRRRRPPGKPRRERGLGPWLAVTAALLIGLSGCSDMAYYWQAGMGQLEVLNRRRPIPEVVADPAVPETVKAKLKLVLQVQDYGVKTLGLPDEGRFKYYADLEREEVSWLVVASEAFAIREVPQCFLIVGCLGYRGFFDRAKADRFAAKLGEQGYDTLVRPVQAYSTLGWFDDPVLNTYIRAMDARLVSTVLHEQAHRVLFIKGDTGFNESFATFVEEEGVRRFLSSRGEAGEKLLKQYTLRNADQELFRKTVLRGKARLEEMYKAAPPSDGRPAAKERLFEEMRRDYQKEKKSFKMLNYDGWFNRKLNNAHLVGFSHYRSRVAAFRALLARHGGDLTAFYRAARELSRLERPERERRLKALEDSNLAKS